MVRFTALVAITTALIGASLASAHSNAKHSNTGLLQMVTYVKRRPSFTRDEFWTYWETQHAPKVVPLATYFNITRYQQVSLVETCPTREKRSFPLTSMPHPGPSGRQDPAR